MHRFKDLLSRLQALLFRNKKEQDLAQALRATKVILWLPCSMSEATTKRTVIRG